MRREHPGQIVSPETVQPVKEHGGDKDSNMDKCEASRRREEIKPRENQYRRPEKETQPPSLRNDANHQHCEEQAPRQTTQLLEHLHSTDCLLDLTWRKLVHFSKARNHAGSLLKSAGRQGVATSE